MKKIFVSVFNISLVLVPIILLMCGIIISTGPIWDVLMSAGIVFLVIFAFKKYIAVRNGARANQARFMVGLAGVLMSFLSLVAQAIFCHLHGAQFLVCEGAVVWLFFLMALSMINAMIEDELSNGFLKVAMILVTVWVIICCIGGVFDFYEYLSGTEIPKRLGNFFGVLSPVTGIGSLVLGIIGVIKENIHR